MRRPGASGHMQIQISYIISAIIRESFQSMYSFKKMSLRNVDKHDRAALGSVTLWCLSAHCFGLVAQSVLVALCNFKFQF